MTSAENHDDRIETLKDEAKKLLEQNNATVPIWAIGCLLGEDATEHSTTKKIIGKLQETIRLSFPLIEYYGNPNPSVDNRVPIKNSITGVTAPGLFGTNIYSGANVEIKREDVITLLKRVRSWPLKKDSLLHPYFGEVITEIETENKNNKLDIKNLFVNLPQNKNTWLRAIVFTAQLLIDELEEYPIKEDVWERLNFNPPEKYPATPIIDHGEKALSLPNEKPLTLAAFNRRWKNWTK